MRTERLLVAGARAEHGRSTGGAQARRGRIELDRTGSNCWQPCSLRSLFLLNVCEIAARATPTEQCVAYDEHDEHDELNHFEHASYNLKRLLLHAQTQLLLSIEVCRVCRGMQGWRARELCETVVLRSFPAFLHTLHTLHTFYEKVLYIYLYRVVGGGGLMRGPMS